jgi:hypothetical protein
MNHTEAIITAFIKPERVPRYMALLAKRGGRAELCARLAHLADLDVRFARLVTGADSTADALERALKAQGAPGMCYCLSEDSELDDREMELGAALARVVGYRVGTFLSCLPGQLAFFEGEGPRERYVLRRPAA